jgi:hypothetical protein
VGLSAGNGSRCFESGDLQHGTLFLYLPWHGMAWHGRPAKAYSVTLTMTMTFLSVNHRPERERQFFCDPFEVNDAIKRILADLSVSISTTTTTTTTNLVDGRLFLFCG